MFILFWQPEMNTKKEGFTMKGIQRFISGWLAVCMVLSMLPMRVFATETNPTQETNEAETVTEETVEQETSVPVSMEPVTETVTVQIVPEVELPDNTELFAAFAERELYGYETATFGITARARLNAIEQRIYDTLKAKIETVALSGGSTVFSVSGISGMKTTWTDTEIDLSRDDAFDLIEAAFFEQFDLDAIVNALLSDCPFDLYWYDKTIGTSMNYWITIDSYTESGQDIWYAAISDMTFAFTVSEDYIAGTNTVTSNVAKVTTAKNNAASVVAANASKSDYEKLKAYKEYICDAVSYNHPAADDNSTPYGDPWQLISVFDGDATTEVVCEGYAKAFQYLCDLGGLYCISVTGTMTGGTGSGNHMWNVVTLEGKNYLVDVTNCDEGTIGAPDLLFLVGAYYEHGAYYVDCGYETLCFICSNLGLEEKDYSESQQPSQPVTTYTVTVEASENGTVTASPATAEAGTVITLTVTPAEGYALKSLTVKQGTADVTVTDNQFTMPEGNVNITAEFEIAPLATDENSLDYLIANLPTVTDPTGAKYYFYNQLSDIEKVMYWKMSEATWNSPTITISGVAAYTSDELYAHAFRALTALQADSPEYHMYWQRKIDVRFTYYDGLYTLTLFKLEGSTDYLIQKAKARVQEIVSIVGTEGDTYSRARDLLEYMFQKMDYSHYYPFRTNTAHQYDHCAIGCLVYNNAMCEGFSDTVKILCDALNIPCIVVGNVGHAWNFIQMDDGLWYSADASADCSFYYVSKSNLIGKIEMQGNSNYTSSDLYLWSAGDFSFPDVPDDDYVYAGNYQETYHDAVNSFIEPDPKFIYSINSDGVSCTITDYEGVQSGDLIVPASIDGYTVTAIGESAFHGCTGFTGDLIIPDTVTIIGDGAFQECTQLSGQLNLPEKTESIGQYAFLGNEKMKGSLNFPDGLSNIGRAAFYKCSSLTGDIRLPNGVTLGDDIFTYCEGLDGTIYLPDNMVWNGNILTGTGITAIEVSENNENYATADGLLYTKDMKRLLAGPGGKTGDLIIPEGVEIISRAAFYGYTNLNGTLKLPESLRIIEEFAIYGTHLTGDVIIPDSVESIGAHAFCGNDFNGQLKLPKNLKRIEEGTFWAQNFSGTLNIPATVEYIGSQAFYGNQELESIIFSGDAPVIESDSFGFLEATCYYPVGNNTWDSVIQNNYGANQTFSWKPYCVGDHVYDQEVIDAKYLVSEATSTTPAVYRKSCKCGAAGEETFTDGALKDPEFKDVPEDAYYYDPVMWAVGKGVTNGYGEADTFAPDIDCTRGQIVTFLWRAAGSPEPASSEMSFDDVAESDFYYKAVLWAVENGITNGYGGADTFAPNVTCTRGQVVTMLNRYLGGKATNTGNPFDDVKEDAFYYDAVLWAAESGITTGTSATTFDPDATCTRGQIVTFLYRALYQHR